MGTILISNQGWIGPIALALALLGIVLFLIYRRMHLPPRTRWACFLLKYLGIAALLFFLLEPLWTGTRPKPRANFFALLADNSVGLQIKDQEKSETRAQELRRMLLQDSSWRKELDETFRLRRYAFDSKLTPVGDFSELNFEGRASRLHTALAALGERFRGQPLAGVLLFTDGNATDATPIERLAGLPPIYPVIIGEAAPPVDLGITRVTINESAFEDAPITITAEVLALGCPNDKVTVYIEETAHVSPQSGLQKASTKGKKFAAQETKTAAEDSARLVYRFEIRPPERGLYYYTLRAALETEAGHPSRTSSEATLVNNRRTVVVDRGKGPFRILYLSGRPNWEFKFLRRALEEDPQLDLVGLIRIAKREPKFAFKGRAGESVNPLYRGFGPKEDDSERYDQPVLIRLNTKDEAELRGGFPVVAEDLFRYHAVVLDDLEAEFFTREQMNLLQKFVSDRGGGFLMLGGTESFREGRYAQTPIAQMLPVYLDRSERAPISTNWQLNLTREGWLEPWVRLRSNEAEEQNRLAEMPPFQVLNSISDIKPGASVLALTSDKNKQSPALAVQRFGHGRSAALMVGDWWRWGFRDEKLSPDLAKAWWQLVRWLVSDSPPSIALEASPSSQETDLLQIQARVRDREFRPLDNAAVDIKVRSVSFESQAEPSAQAALPAVVNLGTEQSLKEIGLYEAQFSPRAAGGYAVEASAKDNKGSDLGQAWVGWVSEPDPEEFRSVQPNRSLLEQIARISKGEIINAANLDDWARSLAFRKAPVDEPWTKPLWHHPLLFLFALGCFIGEWGLRRWKGLA